MNYIGIHITKYVQDLYVEICKIVMTEIKELKKWRDTPWLWIGILNIVKMSILFHLIYRYNTVNKNPNKIFCIHRNLF